MKLYNTLTKQKEELVPIEPSAVSLYTCGPTVYQFAHIGNLRNVVFNDTLRRALTMENLKIKHIMNITDVGHLASDEDAGEDKLEKGAKAEGKTVWEVAEFYTKAFFADTKALNVLEPTQVVKATDAIDAQIEMVKVLLEKEFAYQTDQAIYFDVNKLPDYGKLTGQKLSDKEVGARETVVTDTNKRNPQDFALWFFTTGRFAEHQMHWPTPWGEGFPGWHLECSAIIHQTLGEPIDIHTGGVDHIGTHHTNEIAQSEAAFGKPLANVWLHNEFLLAEGQKMAKSIGNDFKLKDLVDKGYHPMAFRLLMLQSHYRSQQNFTWEALEAAQNFLKRIYAWADLQFQAEANEISLADFNDAMGDDLNTPKALAIISELLDATIPSKDVLDQVETALGLQLDKREDIDQSVKALIAEREEARKAKNFSRSDELRKELLAADIEVEDTTNGPRWHRTKL